MRKKVIVVDDNITSLTIARAILGKKYDAIPVTSGKQMLDVVSKVHPDLVLLDIEMPMMNGFEAMDALREQYIQIPVIFVSGNTDDGVSKERAIGVGAADYITKPFDPDELMETVEKYLSI